MPFQEPARVQLEFTIFLKCKEMKFVVTSPRPFLFFFLTRWTLSLLKGLGCSCRSDCRWSELSGVSRMRGLL